MSEKQGSKLARTLPSVRFKGQLLCNLARQAPLKAPGRIDRRQFAQLGRGIGVELRPLTRQLGFLGVGL